MLFSTPEYIFIFLPAVLFIYYVLTKYQMAALSKFWLIAASSYFYSYSSPRYLWLLYLSLTVNFLIGKRLTKDTYTGEEDEHLMRKILLIAGITGNVLVLIYYKYIDFLIFNLNQIVSGHYPFLKLALPLAISFYTFQQISFLVDCYFSKVKETSFVNYLIYVTFFPQLLSGPILRYWELAPQLEKKGNGSIDWSNISSGLFVFGIGLFKKVIVADSFALFANAGFNTGNTLDFLQAWAASLSYTFQIYYDFSGYTDMAIGAALMFNIRLPINFNSPYKALNIQDFWHRWHITLSRWLRDYLYIPFGGNRKGYSRTLLNLMLTFILAGIWHGAGWTFFVWGTLHGLAMVIHRLWKKLDICLPWIVSWFVTFLFINIAWVFFRAPNLSRATHILHSMFSFNMAVPDLLVNLLHFHSYSDYTAVLALDGPVMPAIHAVFFIVIFPMVAFILPNTMQFIEFVPYNGKFIFKTNLKTAFFLATILFISFLTFVGNVSKNNFIYFNF